MAIIVTLADRPELADSVRAMPTGLGTVSG
jgi:hypothetical protein